MVADDIATWFVILFACILTFGNAMYLCFPVTGWGYSTGEDTIEVAQKMNHPMSTFASVLQLGLMGSGDPR